MLSLNELDLELGAAKRLISELRAENERLRAAILDYAPHGELCMAYSSDDQTECTCWKRDALREVE
jgi:hypothetical protein